MSGGQRAVFAIMMAFTACAREKPVLTGIEPAAASAGEAVTLYGKGFGDSRGESYVTIAGVAPTASSYREWKDAVITLRLPETGDSGLVYVYKSANKNAIKSNPLIFLSSSGIPRLVRQMYQRAPSIDSISPADSAFVGALVTIRGSGFGESRGKHAAGSAVRFTPAGSAVYGGGLSWQAREFDSGMYESWKEREIIIRVPDGAQSGGISVVTEKGESAVRPFAVRYQGGTKNIYSRRTYKITYTVDIQIERADGGNLYIWMPKPRGTAAQNPHKISIAPEPFLRDYSGLALIKFSGLESREKKQAVIEAFVDVSVLETSIDAASVSAAPPAGPEKKYLEASPLIPSADEAVKTEAARITGSERNPYKKAQLIYRAILKEYGLRFEKQASGGALAALSSKTADSYSASMLFCAFARAAGIAARPVAGVLIDRKNTAHNHFWAQFWLENFGWVPVDIALGAGAVPAAWDSRANMQDYYFGSLDNRRIVFSEGEIWVSKIDKDGRAVVIERGLGLQSIFEESQGALETWSSVWGEVIVNAVL